MVHLPEKKDLLVPSSSDNFDSPNLTPPDVDGWVEPRYSPDKGEAFAQTFGALIKKPSAKISEREYAARARAIALLCHMSVLFGFPVFLFYLFRQEDRFVLHHAKVSGTSFVLFYAGIVLSIVLSPALFWVTLLVYLPVLAAIWRASGGHRAGWLGLGPQAEVLFLPIKPRRGLKSPKTQGKLPHSPSSPRLP